MKLKSIIVLFVLFASPVFAYGYHSSYHSYHSYHTYSRPSRGNSFASHGLAALAGGAVGYMIGSSAEHNTTVVHETVEQPPVVVIRTPQQQLTNCSETRKAPEIEQDGQEHVVFIKDCVLQ